MLRRPPRSTLFPYTRSSDLGGTTGGTATTSTTSGATSGTLTPNARLQNGRYVVDKILGQGGMGARSEEHTSELQSHSDLVCRLLLEKKKTTKKETTQRQETR